MKNYILVCLLFPLLMLGQTRAEKREALRQRKVLFDVTTPHKNFTETLSFHDPLGQVVVPVVIEGITYNFLFDSGAVTVISPQLQEKINFSPSFDANITDAANAVKELEFYTIPSLQIGNIAFNNITAAQVDLSPFEEMFCVKIDGVFGTNIMRLCNWKIDYNKNLITFSDKKIKPEWKATQIKFVENYSGSPMILQYMGGKNFYSTLDTGSNGGIGISDSIFFKSTKANMLRTYKRYGKSSVTALSGHSDDVEHAVVIDSIFIGNKLFKNRLVGVEPGGILTGNGFLRKFGELIIDWDKKRVYLPDIEIEDDKGYETFGIHLQRADGRVFVGTLWEGSEAQQQGIKVGDVILSINDVSTLDITQEGWCELYLKAFFPEDVDGVAVTIQQMDGSLKRFELAAYDVLE